MDEFVDVGAFDGGDNELLAVSLGTNFASSPFIGSATPVFSGPCKVAAVSKGRKFIGVEIDDQFFYLSRCRLEEAVQLRQAKSAAKCSKTAPLTG